MAFTRKFYTADTHFGHQGMLTFGGRPFSTVDEMDEFIINAWNRTVGPDDIVYHLGDIGYGDGDRTRSIFSRLNGRKRLVLGNHDVDRKGNTRKDIADLAWDQPPVSYAETTDEGERVILFHYAMRTWSASCHGSYHFFGHSHGKLPAYGRSRDVGVDVPDTGFAPRTFAQLIAPIKEGEIVS